MRYLSLDEQKIMHRALRRSTRLIAEGQMHRYPVHDTVAGFGFAFDEVKHDPKSGQFTSGGGGGSKSKAQQPYTKKFRVGPYEGHLVGPQQWEVRKGGQTISKHRQMNEASTAASRYHERDKRMAAGAPY